MPGYSKKSLGDKLGIKDGMRLHIHGAPENYDKLLLLPSSVKMTSLTGTLDFIQIFVKNSTELKKTFPKAKKALAKDGMLWISWAKKSSPLFTDLTDNAVREIGTKHGLVDVKVCAVTEDWSGLKFVYRLRER